MHLMQEEVLKRLHTPKLGPCACAQVRSLARKLSSLYDTLLSPEDLTITQYSLLANVELAGQLSHAVLAENVGMERTTLTRNLRPLTRAKWVCRRDRPGSTATLASTNSGRKTEAGSQFAVVGGSTGAISVSDRY
jgi:DNA-binding transcriptional ArsR family regulator